MISYIFKNKTKNILAIVFTVLYIISSDLLYEFYLCIIHGTVPYFHTGLKLTSYILILAYLLTLKKQYRFKNWLFPAAFAILTAVFVYLMVEDVYYKMTSYGYLISTDILSYISYIFTIIAYIFCFIGSVYNFKNVLFLRVGMLMLMVSCLAIQISAFFLAGGLEYFKSIPTEYMSSVYKTMFNGIFKILVYLLFYFGIFNLTFNKKSEYIDIMPYVEQQKAKKEAKRAAKREAKASEEAEEQAPIPEVPQGFWRCMACGKNLPDTEQKCECGYKK